MNTRHAEPPIIAFSVRIYQALLLAYPTRFRQEYGSHMAEVFRDCCLRAFRRGGLNGMTRLWLLTLFDFLSYNFSRGFLQAAWEATSLMNDAVLFLA